MNVSFENALYIKLGEKGVWEESSIQEGKIRIGWSKIPIKYLHQKRWDKIEEIIKGYSKTKGSGSNDLSALLKIYNADSQTVFITFYGGKLYWCKPAMNDEHILEDKTSKYLLVEDKWDCRDVKGEVIDLGRVSGKISMLQRYSGTCCTVHEKEGLYRLINGLDSQEYQDIDSARKELAVKVQEGINKLHPKEFELLVELMFRQSGWRRISILGESIKDIDLELEDPITLDKYMVQVKSESDEKEFNKYVTKYKQLYSDTFRKFYYVVHTMKKANLVTDDERIEVIIPEKLAEMVISLGLLDWLLKRIR